MMEAIFSSETSVFTRARRRHMPEDGILREIALVTLLGRFSTLKMMAAVDSGITNIFKNSSSLTLKKRIISKVTKTFPEISDYL
jgi:hypothetical protein